MRASVAPTQLPPHVCVTGHVLRNSASETHRAVRHLLHRQLHDRSSHPTPSLSLVAASSCEVIVLSGTPIQTNLDDIHSLFSLFAPGYLPPYDRFFARYVRPIARSFESRIPAVLIKASLRVEELNRLVQPFLLRRTKEAVLRHSLQAKTVVDEICSITDTQRSMWVAVRSQRSEVSAGKSVVV